MKCAKCGAEIPKNCMYCSVCGKEVQLIPEYNFLDEDMLSSIVEEGAKKALSSDFGKKTSKNNLVSEKIIKKKTNNKSFVWSIIVGAIICGVAALFIIQSEIKKNQANSFSYQFSKAEEYEREKEYQEALEYYYNAWNLNQTDTKVPYRIISIYMRLDKKEEAITLLKERIVSYPDEKKAYQALISIYENEKNYEAITDLCEEVRNGDILELFEEYLVEQPNFAKISGSYKAPFHVKITSRKGYDIYYTLDGSDPVSEGIRYLNAIALPKGTTTVKAVTQNEKGIYSEVISNTYHINVIPPATPVVAPESGYYGEKVNITVQVPADSRVYYTWDGNTPTQESQVYTGQIEMPVGESVLSVIAYNSSGLASTVCTKNYTCELQE